MRCCKADCMFICSKGQVAKSDTLAWHADRLNAKPTVVFVCACEVVPLNCQQAVFAWEQFLSQILGMTLDSRKAGKKSKYLHLFSRIAVFFHFSAEDNMSYPKL